MFLPASFLLPGGYVAWIAFCGFGRRQIGRQGAFSERDAGDTGDLAPFLTVKPCKVWKLPTNGVSVGRRH
jgi:hypothetical protein